MIILEPDRCEVLQHETREVAAAHDFYTRPTPQFLPGCASNPPDALSMMSYVFLASNESSAAQRVGAEWLPPIQAAAALLLAALLLQALPLSLCNKKDSIKSSTRSVVKR